jgi:hypothetical protein
MNQRHPCASTLLIAAGILCVLGNNVHPQQPTLSPRDSTVFTTNGRRVVVEYGKPSIKGRPIMGDYVPYNKVWRTGSGKATTLESNADLRLGDMEIPRGSYSLYTLPSPAGWKLIVNKQTGQWGTVYHPDLDYGRVALHQRTLEKSIEELSIRLEKTNAKSGVLRIEWEKTSLWLPFEILEDSFLASPRDSVEIRIEGERIAVDYGRPFRRGRKIIGGVVPYNEVWRTGANDATVLTTEADLVLEGAEIPRGAYSLFSLPTPKQWLLIINKQTGQSGLQYNRALDLTRVPLKMERLKKPVEQFTICLEPHGSDGAVLRLMWEYTMLSATFRIKPASPGE